MYRWQTLTLARAEIGIGGGLPQSQINAIRDYLISIGVPHFPEPHVGFPPVPAGGVRGNPVLLSWMVEDRHLVTIIDPNGNLTTETTKAGEQVEEFAGSMHYSDRITAHVAWLLNGTLPPPSPAPVATTPKPGDPITKLYPNGTVMVERSSR